MRTRPTAYFIILALFSVFLAFKIKLFIIPAAIIVAIIGLLFIYSRRSPRQR